MTTTDAYRVCVTGGRDYDNVRVLEDELDDHMMAARACGKAMVLIVGDAFGTDKLAREWADSRGEIPVLRFEAQWARLGRKAGPIRNKQMLEEGRPHIVVAFPGGRGTANCVKQARAMGIPVAVVDR